MLLGEWAKYLREHPPLPKPYVAPVAPLLSLRNRAGKVLLALETFDFNDIMRHALAESIDLRGAVLRPHVDNHKQLELATAHLSDLDFDGRDLTRVNFKNNVVFRCNLTGCNLYAAQLNGCFRQCDFTGVNLRRATIHEDPPDDGTFATSGNGKLFIDCILSDLILDSTTFKALTTLGYAVQSKEEFYDDVSDYV
jgi:uncharacterized protein YjbI with pentapeptide repeats